MSQEDSELEAKAVEGYIYLYPLVTMEVTRLQATNVASGEKALTAPMNQFAHVRSFPDADFKMVVRPNFDTLYSSTFLDLTNEPVIISASDTDGRYYLLPMLDMWTDVFAAPGKRTSGTGAASWAVAPQGWRGMLPDGVERIDAPTPYVWMIGRTQTNGPDDYEAVRAIQDGLDISLLSQWGKPASPVTYPIDPNVNMTTAPLDQVNAMSGTEFFTLAAELMKLHPPHLTDWSQVQRLRALGVVPGESFSHAGLDQETADAISAAPAAAQASLFAELPSIGTVTNGWQMITNTMGVYGDYYAKRALVSMMGLGANQPEDAIYPLLVHDADGEAVDGKYDYVMHFDAAELPPVSAFWSLTMYDEQGFQVANELSRFAIGDRDPLKYGPDGSLDLYVQHANPGPEREANWLPAPAGRSGITLRLYAPTKAALDGSWSPPPLTKV